MGIKIAQLVQLKCCNMRECEMIALKIASDQQTQQICQLKQLTLFYGLHMR